MSGLDVTIAILVAYVWLTVVSALVTMLGNYVRPYDDTDFKDRRSNLEVRTDARTGCQYLVTQRGGITPRLDQNGKHICGEG